MLDRYSQGNGLSVCFCILHMDAETEKQLCHFQKQMSEWDLPIRQSFVYGAQTVNALEFSRFFPGHETKIERAAAGAPAHEALMLAAGMIRKEIEYIRRKAGETDWQYLLLIVGEEAALQRESNRSGAYQTVKRWVLEQEEDFTVEVCEME